MRIRILGYGPGPLDRLCRMALVHDGSSEETYPRMISIASAMRRNAQHRTGTILVLFQSGTNDRDTNPTKI
jgi:hypothetical protein